MGEIERASDIAGDGCMDSDADAAVFPGRNFRRRRRFGTILVSSVVGETNPVVIFRHSLRGSVCRRSFYRKRASRANASKIHAMIWPWISTSRTAGGGAVAKW